jgi:hypothetical protein
MLTTASRVKNSIELLDSKAPKNWRTLVNWDSLDLSHCELCVLGQLYGNYMDGLDALHLEDGAGKYAFISAGRQADEMHTEWRKQVKTMSKLVDELVERRNAAMLEADDLLAQRQALDIAFEAVDRQLTDLQKCINALS